MSSAEVTSERCFLRFASAHILNESVEIGADEYAGDMISSTASAVENRRLFESVVIDRIHRAGTGVHIGLIRKRHADDQTIAAHAQVIAEIGIRTSRRR